MGTGLGDSLLAWTPELVLSVGAIVILLLGVFARRTTPAMAATGAAIAAAGLTLWDAQRLPAATWFFSLIALDPTAHVFRWLSLGVVALVCLMAVNSDDVDRAWTGEYLALFVLVGVGLMLMAEANHLLMAYLAMEFVSLSSYVLVALVRDARSSEAALKYLLFGALSSGIMLFGMSLVFGLTGQLSFPLIRQAAAALGGAQTHALAVAVAMVLAGVAFKISMVPFHLWTPDAYEGAPIPVTAMLSVGPKAAGLALLLRFTEAVHPLWPSIAPLVAVLTVVTVTFGNVVAVVQQNIKRLLAYSAIGQVGYLLIGFSVGTPVGIGALLVYLVAYLFMNLGAFACVVAVCNATRSESLEAFRGLSQRAPALAALCALFLLSLAGLPPLVGFVGKFLLFGAAIQSHQLILAFAGILNSAIALYYYVNIIRLMYVVAPTQTQPIRPALSLRVALGVCGAATVGLGLFPAPLLALISQFVGTS